MLPEISRRELLKWGALTATAPSALVASRAEARTPRAAARQAAAALAAGPATELPLPPSWVIKPFANGDVALGQSLFTANRDRVYNFLSSYSADRILSIFRTNAGLDNMGAQPPGGWETADGNLRGHYAGHFLSALSLAYAAGAGDAYKTKLDYIVTALGQCQDALAAQVGQQPSIGRVAGRFGSAVKLSGSSQYVALPNAIVNGLTDFTISLWVNLAATTTYSRLFDFGTGTTRYMFLTVNAGSGPRFAITTGGSNAEQRISATSQLPTNTWTHVAVTLAGGTGTLYVNGSAVATNSAMTLSPTSVGSTANNWIGRSQYSDPYLNGSVDEFQIFGHALTAAQVAALATSADGGVGGGDVAWYRFDESDGATAKDASANARDATIVTGAGAGPSYPGYLAAYPETQYIQLEQYATYPTIWAPWYTCHMIMRGLLDAYLLGGNQQAFQIVLGMANWAHSRLAHLPRAQLDRMWTIYIAGEYNAMPVVLADIAALTGDDQHLETAKCFINTAFFNATVAGQDTVDGKHANQHIPQFEGYLEIFEQTAEPQFFAAAANFWDMVVNHRTYTDGGMAGTGEIFGARDVIAATINGDNAETCPVYNMLKLSRSLFFHTGDPDYMQYYERALYGQILASRQAASSATNPLLTYFVPMAPGSARSYGNLGTCCGGTGLESHSKFQDSIYFSSIDESTLYVNLYMPSTLNWADKGFKLAQSTNYPTDPSGTVVLTVTGDARLDIKLRVPYWVQRGFTVKCNGAVQSLDAQPGTYVTLSRQWTTGDTIEIAAPFSLRVEKTLDQPRVTQSIAYGPVPMVALSNATTYQALTLDADLTASIAPAADPMTFTTNGLTLRPFYIDDTTRYHAYFHRVNRAPALASDQTVAEGQALAFHVGLDPDGDACTHTVDGLPPGAQLDAGSGLLTWTPTYTQAGTYTLQVRVDDGLEATSGAVVVSVSEVAAADQVNGLKAYIAGESIDGAAKDALSAPLDHVLALLADGKPTDAVTVLNDDFLSQVDSLHSGGRVSDAEVAELRSRALAIDANVTDNTPAATPTPTPTATPTPTPEATPVPSASVAPAPKPPAAIQPKPPGAAGRTPSVARIQRGNVVRGSLIVARAHSRLQVELMATRSALGSKGHGDVRVGRSVKSSVGGKRIEFAVALDAAARRALRRHGKLTLNVKVMVTPQTGAPYTVTKVVTLHHA
jgi:DUF1680 family protein